jgi:pyrroline-5-carboxylate reductase
MKISEYCLGFVGFGHMAQIIFEAIQAAQLISRSQIGFLQRDPAKMRQNERKYDIASASMKHLVSVSDLLILCVRPGQAQEAASEMARFGASKKKIISVLAGVPLSFFQTHFGQEAQILRMMPNVASSIGEGMNLLSFSSFAKTEFRSIAQMLMAPLGRCLEIPENQMDAATGIAGSGPGFVFKLIQAMTEVGEKAGISRENALFMACQTFLGAAHLARKVDLNSLMTQIATPGGTTEAGFQVMEKQKIAKHFQETIEAAIQKAKSFSAISPHLKEG